MVFDCEIYVVATIFPIRCTQPWAYAYRHERAFLAHSQGHQSAMYICSNFCAFIKYYTVLLHKQWIWWHPNTLRRQSMLLSISHPHKRSLFECRRLMSRSVACDKVRAAGCQRPSSRADRCDARANGNAWHRITCIRFRIIINHAHPSSGTQPTKNRSSICRTIPATFRSHRCAAVAVDPAVAVAPVVVAVVEQSSGLVRQRWGSI